jgi:hypothetical protein
MRGAAAALLLVACSHHEPIASCSDDLGGVWRADISGTWMILDNGKTLEIYPLFDDMARGGAPRVIDVTRGDKLDGTVKRRFMQGAAACEARVPFHVTACKDDALQVVRAETAPPLTFSPCTWESQIYPHVENWHRE